MVTWTWKDGMRILSRIYEDDYTVDSFLVTL